VKVNVEFVSANPTGPLHVGHGRGAALGDAIAALLQWTGHDVTREFYINDAGVQIDRLAQSLWARRAGGGRPDRPHPEGGYHGEYLKENAALVLEREAAPSPTCRRTRACVGAACWRSRSSERSRIATWPTSACASTS
jgi:arginyl-tRNA synthetase